MNLMNRGQSTQFFYSSFWCVRVCVFASSRLDAGKLFPTVWFLILELSIHFYFEEKKKINKILLRQWPIELKFHAIDPIRA